jgi:hypothetical protein
VEPFTAVTGIVAPLPRRDGATPVTLNEVKGLSQPGTTQRHKLRDPPKADA